MIFTAVLLGKTRQKVCELLTLSHKFQGLSPSCWPPITASFSTWHSTNKAQFRKLLYLLYTTAAGENRVSLIRSALSPFLLRQEQGIKSQLLHANHAGRSRSRLHTPLTCRLRENECQCPASLPGELCGVHILHAHRALPHSECHPSEFLHTWPSWVNKERLAALFAIAPAMLFASGP